LYFFAIPLCTYALTKINKTQTDYGPYCYRYKVTPTYKYYYYYYYYLYLLILPLCGIVNVGWVFLQGGDRSSCIQLSLKPTFFFNQTLPINTFVRWNVSYASRLNIIKNSTNFTDRTLERCNLLTCYLTSGVMQAADAYTPAIAAAAVSCNYIIYNKK